MGSDALNFVRGDDTGLSLPAHPDALREAGPAFLTPAFRTFGALSADNEVAHITRIEPCSAGNSGQKLFLSVAYRRPGPELHTDLFVKFSRDLADPFRDRRKHELEAEVRLAKLSRHPRFPIATPAAYFADAHKESGTGILITQRIAFGERGVEPLVPKCMDHALADAPAYYRATLSALAQLAASHKSGQLSPQLDTLFPFDAVKAGADLPIALNATELRERVARYAAFAETCRPLLPAHLVTPNFIAKLERDALRFLERERDIRRFLHDDPAFIALCHWNTHVDNAWFWRDAAGALRCGLLDWGMVRQMNVGYALWGGLSAATPDMLDAHLNALLRHFITELAAHGGPMLDLMRLRLHFDLSVALLGLALMMDVPALILSRLPEAKTASGPLDPIMHRNEVARSFLCVFTNFLHLWARHDFGASIDRTPAPQT